MKKTHKVKLTGGTDLRMYSKYHSEISKEIKVIDDIMYLEKLEEHIHLLEQYQIKNLSSQEQVKCYNYAKVRLAELKEERRQEEEKRKIAEREKAIAEREKAIAEREKAIKEWEEYYKGIIEEMKNLSDSIERTNRINELVKIGSVKIKNIVMSKYKDVYKDDLEKLSVKKRNSTLYSMWTALNKIDFIKGKIEISKMFGFIPLKFVYLKDKGVILLDRLLEGEYVFFYQQKNDGTEVSTITTEEQEPFTIVRVPKKNKLIQEWFYDTLMRYFPFVFF